MRILSLRRGFEADHSSSSYEFFALDKLAPEQRQAVQDLTGEAARRRLRFHYLGDWSDIPGDWPDKLLTLGYDVLVSESYDWWAVRLSLPHDPSLIERLSQYDCDADGNGFRVRVSGERMILYFGMQLDYGAAYDEFGEDPFEGLADLFGQVRDELLAGDLSVVWAMYEAYGGYGDAEPEPVEPLSESAQTLLNVMESY
ncbi:MAG: hypothetical protein JXC32_07030 [Anaerolineae bacterium]|nr:hypothetical protein [Anaerolineae bacterium]